MNNPAAIKLADYQPSAYQTKETHLTFEIADGTTRVRSQMNIVRVSGDDTTPLELDGENLELVEVRLNGESVSSNAYQLSDSGLKLFGLAEQNQLEIITRIIPEENKALEGLYRSESMYCTQCEAQGFRRITYYQDRPDIQSRFTTTVIADKQKCPILLSNGNLIASEDLGDGRHKAVWQDPFPKPSYLFALVAGDLAKLEGEFTTMSGRKVDLVIYCEPHNIDQCDYAMGALKRAMRWDETRFGREYDLDIFMIVAADDFNMGAMENKGLNIFNTSAVLATKDTATDLSYQRIEAIIGHEYFHNWSGNRVTCRDWFQLSLKEGFTVFRDAEFTGDMNSHSVKRIEDVRFLRSVQFVEDAGPLAHAVRPESYIEISNFYTTTIYEKGAEVVRMMHTLLGEEKFRRGSDQYFDKFDGTAATTEDFVVSMESAGDIDLQQFRRWYSQAGTPEIAVTEKFNENTLELQLTQSCPATPGQTEKKAFHIPLIMGLVGRADETIEPEQISSPADIEFRDDGFLLHIREPVTQVSVSGLKQKPGVSVLRRFSAPVRLAYPRSNDELAFLILNDQDGFARWDALQSLWISEIESIMAGGSVSALTLTSCQTLIQMAIENADDSQAKQMYATLLSLPSEAYLFDQFDNFDVINVCDARERLKNTLARQHQASFAELFASNQTGGIYKPDALDMGQRALANLALNYLSQDDDVAAVENLLRTRFAQADNLTDRQAVLAAATGRNHLQVAFGEELLAEFYEQFKHQALVVDVWFRLQAGCPRDGTLQNVLSLEYHDAFDAFNPNKLRALYFAFAGLNPRNLHNTDGQGYLFVAQRVKKLDGSNPQMAARLATILTQWSRFDATRQTKMKQSLQWLADSDELSKDVFEVVNKGLD